MPIIERGEGPYLFDVHGKRYLDMLSGLFTVQIGYSYGEELGQAALEQMRKLPYYTNWTFAHPPAAELAARLAGLAPPGINRAFFVSGGSEAVESAWKLARQYHAANGQPMRRKVIARKVAYHGTTMGALSITGITAIRTPFEPLVDGVRHVANTNRYRCKYCADSQECTLACADEVAETIEQEGPETVAMVIMEPVQNSGGTFTPHPDYHRRVREICDAYGVLQVADEVICGFGRLGEWFGCERYGYEPDLITCAKGLTSGYASLGAVLISDRVAEPFVERGEYYLHGITFGGHPVATAIARANLDVMERLDLLANVRANEAYFARTAARPGGRSRDRRRRARRGLLHVARAGQGPRDAADVQHPRSARCCCAEFLSPQLQEAGVICRADDRGDPVIQLSPPADLHARAHRRGGARARLGAARARRGSCAGKPDGETHDGRPRGRAAERLDVPGAGARRRVRPGRRRRRPRARDARRRLPARRLPVAARRDRRRAVVLPAAARRPPARSPPRLALAGAQAAPLRLRVDRRRGVRGGRRGMPRAAGGRARHVDQRRAGGCVYAGCTRSGTRTASRSGTATAWSAASTACSSAACSAANRCSTARRMRPRSHSPISSRGCSRRAAACSKLQHVTPHLRSLGAIEIERALYLGLLAELRDDDVSLLCERLPVSRLGTGAARA